MLIKTMSTLAPGRVWLPCCSARRWARSLSTRRCSTWGTCRVRGCAATAPRQHCWVPGGWDSPPLQGWCEVEVLTERDAGQPVRTHALLPSLAAVEEEAARGYTVLPGSKDAMAPGQVRQPGHAEQQGPRSQQQRLLLCACS